MLLCIVICSCNEAIQSDSVTNVKKVIQISDAMQEDTTQLSSIVDSVFFVKLEQNEKFPIGKIHKTIFLEDRIIIFDRFSQAVFIYNYSGAFLSCIKRQGKGEGEYFKIADIAIDYNKQEILLKDNFLGKILCFDYEGNYVETLKNNFYGHDFLKIDNETFILYNTRNSRNRNNLYQLLYVSDKDKLVGNFLSFPKSFLKDNRVLRQYLVQDKYRSLLLDNYENIIYSLHPDSIVGELRLDFGKYNLPQGKHWNDTKLDYTKYAKIYSFFESESYIYISYCFDTKKSILMIINKLTNEVIKFHPTVKLSGTVDYMLFGTRVGVYKDFLVHYKEPHKFSKCSGISQELKCFLEKNNLHKMSPIDNPVLVFVKFK